VAVIASGVEEGARRWKKDSGCAFPMYLDRSRGLYNYFGMGRSLKRTFNQDTMIYYIGKKLGPVDPDFNTNPYPDIPDDRLQMGGDVLFTKEGVVEFSHLSASPVDRAAFSKILEILKNKNKS